MLLPWISITDRIFWKPPHQPYEVKVTAEAEIAYVTVSRLRREEVEKLRGCLVSTWLSVSFVLYESVNDIEVANLGMSEMTGRIQGEGKMLFGGVSPRTVLGPLPQKHVKSLKKWKIPRLPTLDYGIRIPRCGAQGYNVIHFFPKNLTWFLCTLKNRAWPPICLNMFSVLSLMGVFFKEIPLTALWLVRHILRNVVHISSVVWTEEP